MSLLDELNAEQRAAAAHAGGPMLILAGAGSGKTRVITYRIAHLLAGGVRPERLVAVTFTNKAAGEMRERVLRLLGRERDDPAVPWMGTFHGACLRLLRVEVDRTGLRRGFLVYDQDDSRALVRTCERELGVDDKLHPPARVAAHISRLKAACLGPDQAATMPGDFLGVVAQVYREYQSRLVEANASDFDDLLMRAVLLLEGDESVRAKYQERTAHLLVDEYQDTNPIQYRLIRLLAGGHQNVCAVGDEDQSIYRFRGADIGNILNFERDFPGTRIFRIERNYRSTGNILAAANGVVSRNAARKGKVLWTDAGAGSPVVVHSLSSDLGEADWVAQQAALRAEECGLSEVAVMYRTNAQSRLLEEALARRQVPHVVIGGLRFYERREIKDIVAYLRLVVNPDDDVALERVINVPPRGVGRGALESIRVLARERKISLGRAVVQGIESGAFSGRVEKALDAFVEILDGLRRAEHELALPDLVRQVIERTFYFAELEKEGPGAARDRRQNLEELVSAAAEHELRDGESGLVGFLTDVALASDTDDLGAEGRVQLMTLHSAKGLEFDSVFLVGLEEGFLPHASASEDADVEEERRLCYVGMTRARKHLVLSRAARRRVFGQERSQAPSRFIAEIPPENVRRLGPEPIAAPSRAAAGAGSGAVREGSRDAVASFFGDAQIPYEDLSQDPADEETAPAAFHLGDRVRHGKYGVGTIVGIDGGGDDAKLRVSFFGRTVKLIQRYAGLRLA